MAANQEELLAYLSQALLQIPLGPQLAGGQNTSNPRYGPQDITHVGTWAAFTYHNVIEAWGTHLSGPACATMQRPPIWGNPCQPLNSESQFKNKFADIAEGRIRRAIRTGFTHIDGNNNNGLAHRGMSQLEFLHGGSTSH
jgi:hypothetical protein